MTLTFVLVGEVFVARWSTIQLENSKFSWERVQGFKYSLRHKYFKQDTTKDALYNLEKSKRPSAVGEQMWVGLVDYFLSEKLQGNLKIVVLILPRLSYVWRCFGCCFPVSVML